MDNQNSLPKQNNAPIENSLKQSSIQPQPPRPNPTISNDTQIFIHPDHESGTLTVPQQTNSKTPKKKVDLMLVLLSIVSGSLIIIGSAIFFILIPRSQNVTFATSIKDTVSSSSDKTDKVNSSLEVLYKAITKQEEDITLSQYQDLNVLPTAENSLTSIFNAASNLAKRTKDNLDQKENVKSFAVPAGDPNEEARQHRELAQSISDKSSDANEINQELSDLVSKPVQIGVKELKFETTELIKTTTKYIEQATYTADYYIALNEASIELVTLASSLNSAKDIDNAISKLASLKTRFAEYEKAKLPEKIEDYNNDIVEILDLLLVFYQDVKAGKLDTEEKIVKSYTVFMTDLQGVAARSTHDQISFWQNNDALKSFSKLSSKQTEVQKQAEKVKDANNFFLLEWAGVS